MILDLNDKLLLLSFRINLLGSRHNNLRVRWRKLNRIGQQIYDNLLDPQLIQINFNFSRQLIELYRHTLQLSLRYQHVNCVQHCAIERCRLQIRQEQIMLNHIFV